VPSQEETGRRPDITRSQFVATLKKFGVDVPATPTPTQTSPQKWLLRGENGNYRLINPAASQFQPQSGEWGRYGVFTADSLSPVVFPCSGAIYVFDRDQLFAPEWVSISSLRYRQLLEKVAEERNLDLSKIGDGVEAELAVAKQYHLYDPKTSITTLPVPISLNSDSIRYVLLTPDNVKQIKVEKLPEWLREKTTILQ